MRVAAAVYIRVHCAHHEAAKREYIVASTPTKGLMNSFTYALMCEFSSLHVIAPLLHFLMEC